MPVVGPRPAPGPVASVAAPSIAIPSVPGASRLDAASAGAGPAAPGPLAPGPQRHRARDESAARPVPPADPVAVPGGGIRGDGTQTLVFRKPAPAPTRAVLRVVAKDGSERTVEVDGTPLTLGRATDNGLTLADPRVSRHHARLQARRGTLVFTDLGSTNGSRVNGVRVDECALGTGDRILVGDTVLLVEQLPG